MSTLPGSTKEAEIAGSQALVARGGGLGEAHLEGVKAHEDLCEEARAAAGHDLAHVCRDGAHAQYPAWRALAEEVPLVDARWVLFAHHLEVVRAHVADGEFFDGGFVAPDKGRLVSAHSEWLMRKPGT